MKIKKSDTPIVSHVKDLFLNQKLLISTNIDKQMAETFQVFGTKALRYFSLNEAKQMLNIDNEDKETIYHYINKLEINRRGMNNHYLLTLEEILTIKNIMGLKNKDLLKGKSYDSKRETLVLSAFCYKGGVGKTTTSINLAHYLAKEGYNVCFIDTDAQSSSCYFFGLMPSHDIKNPKDETILGLLTETNVEDSIEKIKILKTHWPNIDLIPSHPKLSGIDDQISKNSEYWNRIKRLTSSDKFSKYDVVIIDTSPAYNMINLSVAFASHMLLIPAYPSSVTLWSLSELYGFLYDSFENIESISNEKSNIKSIRILPTLFTKLKSDSCKKDLDELRAFHNMNNQNLCYPVEMYRKPSVSLANALFSTVYEMTYSESKSYADARNMFDNVNSHIEQDLINLWSL